MNIPDLSEFKEKERRVRILLDKCGYDAVVIGRQDNFSWYTCGGNNRVLITSETGFTILVITKLTTYAIAQIMDGPRVFDEELKGFDIEPVFLKWYEQSREEKVEEMIKGLRVLSDIPIKGATCAPGELYRLHYPLTEKEIEKCRRLGRITEEIFINVSNELRPGMTEREIEALMMYEYARNNTTCEVLLVGSDERISKYRHPNPSDKKIEKFVLLHSGARREGLHANVTRMVYFGDSLPQDIKRRYDAVSKIEAASLSMCIPGKKFAKILELQKRLFREAGFANEWENHFQGAITGYLLADPNLCKNPDAEVVVNQAYDWFITITGVKVEELSINTKKGVIIPSVTGIWPTDTYEYNGQEYELPAIMLK